MQNLLSNKKNLSQKTGNFYVLQYKSPEYATKDLDEYYEKAREAYMRIFDRCGLRGYQNWIFGAGF